MTKNFAKERKEKALRISDGILIYLRTYDDDKA